MFANLRSALMTVINPTVERRRDSDRRFGSLVMTVVIASLLIMWGMGCSTTWDRLSSALWVADYDTAEQRAKETGRGMLILYKDTRPGADNSLERVLESAPVEGRTRRYVRCILFRSYEPDRRYVAQFGVERAPALVVIHPDGTYHARSGAMSASDVMAFLAQAAPPGRRPLLNPHIPREADYRWLTSLDAAESIAGRTDRPILAVFYRTLSRDWSRLEPMLDRHEVYSRLAPMVHCRIGLMRLSSAAYITRFGALKLPAMVIAHPDGTYDVLELPTSYEAIARFVDAFQAPHGQPDARRAKTTDR